MTELSCNHCGREIDAKDNKCPNCGIPLAPNHHVQRQHKFIIWFVALVIFCFFMMIWLPPNWT